MKSDFQVPTLPFQIDDRNFLSYIGQANKAVSKKFITDFDGIFEAEGTEPLYKLFFKRLAELNSAIDLYKIDRYIQRIQKGESAKDVFKEIADYLKSPEVDLRKYQYDRACDLAARDWTPSREIFQTLNELKRRGYEIVIISGSPQEAIEKAVVKITPKPYKIWKKEYNIYGTRFEFVAMLGEEKLNKKKAIIGEETHITATDDLKTDYFINYGAEISIIVAPQMPISDNQLYIFDVGIRKRFSALLQHINKFEYSFVRSALTTKETEERIVQYTLRMKKALQEGEFKEFLRLLKLLNITMKEFNLFARKAEIITQYEIEIRNHGENEKSLLNQIITTLQQLPEYASTEAFAEQLGIK